MQQQAFRLKVYKTTNGFFFSGRARGAPGVARVRPGPLAAAGGKGPLELAKLNKQSNLRYVAVSRVEPR